MTTQPGPRRQARERGAISPFLAVASLGLLAAIGLAYDIGGTQVTAQQQANAYAAEAARTGGQAITAGTAIQGGHPTLNHTAAVTAARRYLRAAGVTGRIHFTTPTTLSVDTTITRRTVFLSVIGIDHVTADGHATARIRRGVTGEEQP